ncbi:MAG TPA: O-antigen ligase family protein [Phycisphaerae bacterium]|nr:O-antigen ligase family protein [Phycisphaerae bacterium]
MQNIADIPDRHGLARHFDRAVEILMVVLLVFMPLAFGAVDAWSEEVVVALAGAMLACLLLKVILVRGTGLVWSWAYLPVGGVLLLAAAQLLPLPAGLVACASPHTAGMKADLLADMSGSNGSAGAMTLSFYPFMTTQALRMAMSAVALFVVTVNVYRRPEQIRRLLAVVSAVGGAVALLALAQIASGTDKIYWLVPTRKGAALGGPFFNRNNYCQFTALSIGAALGLLLVKLEAAFRNTPIMLSGVVDRLTGRKARGVWYLAGAIALGLATIFLSLSRGGMISVLAAATATAVVLTLKRRLNIGGWAVMAMALAALVCVLCVGFDAVYDRLADLRKLHDWQGRWDLAKSTTAAWARFPVFGCGLGTHEVVYPMFDKSTISAVAVHAENEYAQLAEETGLVGVVLIAVFGAVVCHSYVRCVSRPVPPVRIAAIGLGFGLLAVAIHSFTDFGQRLPANGCLSAVFCGLLIGMAKTDRLSQAPATIQAHSTKHPRVIAGLALACVLAGWTWAFAGADNARRAEGHWFEAEALARQMRAEGWAVGNANYARLIAAAGRAAQAEPGNAHYRYWLSTYRWLALSRVKQAGTTILLGPGAMQSVRQIVEDLDDVRRACPTFGPAYALAGQLEWFVLGRPRGAVLIRKGFTLAPCSATACFAAGLLDAHEGKMSDSLVRLRRAVALDGKLLDKAARVYVGQVNRAELAVDLAGEDYDRLMRVAAILREDGRHDGLAAEARARALDALRVRCTRADAPARDLANLASLCVDDGRYAEAVAHYRRALAKDCSQVGWRLDFARALAKAGRIPEAIEQVSICLELAPQADEAKGLLAELRVRPEALQDN